ncbi:unnamed protein product [Macrosiphum euphorbiae]|uniref:Uncharacterized protein n=1 Tax=Macrosiphum euphorbiae TaxID=13131 RepID=A0AAV0W6D6_9HEMI|nr:unnamed protein product [Macrosiphum euphorbiae]
MAGSIAGNLALYKKTFNYVPPTPPAELLEATNFTLDFVGRKFIQIGIDPTNNFKVVLLIITPSRYVRIFPDTLKQILNFMGQILSFILEQPQRYKRVTFFETDTFKLSSMVYSGENVLVIESKNVEGCRVLLNRTDLLQLQRLEYAIFEAIVRKDVFTVPLLLKQIDQFGEYLEERCSREKSPPKNIEERKLYIKNIQLDRDDRIVQSAPNLTRQIQIYAVTQLAENWENRKAQKSQESCYVDPKILSPSCPPKSMISSLQDDTCTIRDAFDKPEYQILANPLDHIDGPQSPSFPRINIRDGFDLFNQFDSPTSAHVNHPTAAPLRGVKRRLPQSPASPPPFDVNDGPDYFNPIGTSTPYFNPTCTSTPCQPTFAQYPASVRDVRRSLF